jgi:hypothetical protein
MYCEQSPNETSVQVQSVYSNENLTSNHWHIYVKSEQVKQKGGKAERKERGRQSNREREKRERE